MSDLSPERDAVIREAMSWRGTPFRDAARVKGPRGGVDCGQILCAVYENAGVCGHVETSKYNLQFMLNCREERYIEELLNYSREITAAEALPGDIVVLRWGHVYSHGAILLSPWPGRIIHALNPFGVIETDASCDGRILATLRKYPDSPPRFFRPLNW